jgi:hypothetical protein
MITRGPKIERYTQIDNAVLRDERLSYRARGILAYVLSHVEGWTVTSDSIAQHGKEGREAVRTAMRELEAAGYLERIKVQQEDGQWRTDVIVHEVPKTAGQTDDGFPGVGFPAVGFPGANKKTIEKTITSDDVASGLSPEPVRAKSEKAQCHDAMAEALVDACGWDRATLTKGAWGRVHKAAKELTSIGATPEQVGPRARAYASRWPNVDLTPNALSTNWASLVPEQERVIERSINVTAAITHARTWTEADDLAEDVIRRLRTAGLDHPDEISAALDAVCLREEVAA